MKQLSATALSHELQDLQPWTEYSCRLTASTSEGEGPHSALINFTTSPGEAGPEAMEMLPNRNVCLCHKLLLEGLSESKECRNKFSVRSVCIEWHSHCIYMTKKTRQRYTPRTAFSFLKNCPGWDSRVNMVCVLLHSSV